VWAEELRRADERALKFKQDMAEADAIRMQLDSRVKELERAVSTREQEIQRLTLLYKGGQNFDSVKVSFDRQSAEAQISSLAKQNEFLNGENHRLGEEMREIKELLGVCESRDPTDVDRAHLKKLVRELKGRNETMAQEVRDLTQVVNHLKEGRYNEIESGKFLTEEEIRRLKSTLEQTERERAELVRENQRMRAEGDKVS